MWTSVGEVNVDDLVLPGEDGYDANLEQYENVINATTNDGVPIVAGGGNVVMGAEAVEKAREDGRKRIKVKRIRKIESRFSIGESLALLDNSLAAMAHGLKAPSGKQKSADTYYPDASDIISRYSIGKKAREDAITLIKRKRPDLAMKRDTSRSLDDMLLGGDDPMVKRSEEELNSIVDGIVDEIGKFDSPKEQKAALHWFIKGAISLPEDAPKVTEAIKYGERAKGKANTDPMSYPSPMAMIEALHEFKPKEKPINPDTVPQLSDKRDMGYGVTTYLVQDDREGQQAMRRIINTHWGEDANPWCLLHGDGKGNLSDGSDGGYDAWHYWNHYNALPKRVAFKNGKLLAFMATEGMNEEQAFDDAVYGGGRLAELYPDEFAEYENALKEDEETRENQPNFYEWLDHNYGPVTEDDLRDRIPEQWWDRQDKAHDGIPLGNMPVPGDEFGRWTSYKITEGKLKQIGGFHKTDAKGNVVRDWFANGFVANEYYGDDGMVSKHWNINGTPIAIQDLNKQYSIRWDDNGNVEHLSGVTKEEAERIYREESQKTQRFNPGNPDIRYSLSYDTPVQEVRRAINHSRLTDEAKKQMLDVLRVYSNRDNTYKRGFGKAPNGKKSNLNIWEWLLVRTPAFRDNFFGDWLNLWRKEMLMSTAPVTIQKRQLPENTTPSEAREIAVSWVLGIAPIHFETEIGDFIFDKKSVETTLGHKFSNAKYDALFSIPDGFRNAVYIGSLPDFDGKNIYNHYFAYPAFYNNKRQIVFCRARETPMKSALYVHDIFVEEDVKNEASMLLPDSSALKAEVMHGIHRSSKLMRIILKLIYAVNPSDVSKVVDENSEPQVVYRGAPYDPLAQEPGKGVIAPERYFSPNEKYARRYEKGNGATRAYFLNLRKPFDIRNEVDAQRLLELRGGHEFATGASGALDWAEAPDAEELNERWDGEYDGLVLDEGGDPSENGVIHRGISFVPLQGGAQIKSATDNTGAFNAQDPDIRFSITADIITDKDFSSPSRDVVLPELPQKLDNVIGGNGRAVLIKKNIFEKNLLAHPELSPSESRNILDLALYHAEIAGQSQPKKREHYWVAVNRGISKNATVVVDVYPSKDYIEVVGWRNIDERGLKKLKRQAEREDGQLLILSPDNGSAAALSALASNLPSTQQIISQSAAAVNGENISSAMGLPISDISNVIGTRFDAPIGSVVPGKSKKRSTKKYSVSLMSSPEDVLVGVLANRRRHGIATDNKKVAELLSSIGGDPRRAEEIQRTAQDLFERTNSKLQQLLDTKAITDPQYMSIATSEAKQARLLKMSERVGKYGYNLGVADERRAQELAHRREEIALELLAAAEGFKADEMETKYGFDIVATVANAARAERVEPLEVEEGVGSVPVWDFHLKSAVGAP